MVRQGQFVTVSEIIGHCYGLAYSELEKVTDNHRTLLLHMDLSGAHTLRTRGLRPKLIMTLPSSDNVHRQFLREKYCTNSKHRHVNPVKIQNWSAKAKQILEENLSELKSKANIMTMISETLDEDINNMPMFCEKGEEGQETEIHEEEGLKRMQYQESDYSIELTHESLMDSQIPEEDNQEIVCIYSDNIGLEPCSARTSGILKQGLKRPTPPLSTRVSVDEETMQSYIDKMNIARSRSVTFSEEPSHQISFKGVSASQALLTDAESFPILSVLRKIHADTVNANKGIGYKAFKDMEGPLGIFFDGIMSLRRLYTSFHLSNPGVFVEVIYPDDYETAITKISNPIKTVFKTFKMSKPIYNYREDPLFNVYVMDHVKELTKDLSRDYHNRGECSKKWDT